MRRLIALLPDPPMLVRRAAQRARDWWVIRHEHWHIVGDSHCRGIIAAHHKRLLSRPLIATIVGGATAVGLRNPKSITNAIQLFTQELTPLNTKKVVVIHLGEVDCGFLIWYRAQKYGESVEKQFEESLAAYEAFVKQLQEVGYKRIVITAATLPTIRDGECWGEVANARRDVTATIRQRTALTQEYNERLRTIADQNDLVFVDLTAKVVDPLTGLVDDTLRHPDPANHHLNPDKVGPLWAEALEQALPTIRRSGLRSRTRV